jgi:ATP-dependent protease ClpP protease subunit
MIYQFLTSLQIPVVTHSAGITDSSAVSIFLAGTPRFASPNSRFLIHKPSWTFEAKSQFQAAKLKEFAQQMDWDEETHIAIITERSGIALDKVREWHNTGAIFTGAEAIANGLVDEAREFKRPNRCIQFAN